MASKGRARNTNTPSGGFTLAELLVVVSIICLMMSLMLPALTRAQRQGEQTHCLANQHQIALAWQQLVAESDDHLPRLSSPGPLRPYVYDVNEVFLCKSVALDDRGRSFKGRDIDSCYGFAPNLCGGQYDGLREYTTLQGVSHPGAQLFVTDVDPETPGIEFRAIIKSRSQWVWNPWAGLAGVNSQNMTARHADGCNMTFADGHGGYTRWRDPRTLKFIKGTLANPQEASDDNPDLRYVVDILGGRHDVNE